PARITSDATAEVDFTLAVLPGHYVYQDSIEAKVNSPEGVSLEKLIMPEPTIKDDKYLGKKLKIFKGVNKFTARLKLPGRDAVADQELLLAVRYQGCSPELCFLPATRDLATTFGGAAATDVQPTQPDDGGDTGTPAPVRTDANGISIRKFRIVGPPAVRFVDAAGKEYKGERIDGFVKAYELSTVLDRVASGKGYYEAKPAMTVSILTFLAVFAGGLLVSFTPCVWPMIPITTTIVLGSKKAGTGMGFLLSGCYVLGMAVAYAILGTVIASVGGLMGSVLQSPYVVAGISTLFVVMALSMFGLFDLPLVNAGSGKLGGGSVFASLLLGGVSALVLSPCVGPVVASLLLYVAKTSNAALGGTLLFVFGLGMGMPLIAIGTFSGAMQKRPKAGAWMLEVKKLFGVVLIGFAVYFLLPLLNDRQGWILAGGAAAAVGAGLILFDVSRNFGSGLAKAKLVLSILIIAAGVLVVATGPQGADEEAIRWVYSYNEARKMSAEQQKPIMLYFTAGNCSNCKKMKLLTFSDEDVIRAAEGVVPLKVDLTSALAGDGDS
ncbi:MAG: thioredoxin family protein, partial [Planctomycetes bacterium]|nr:thioredoxin family protein [Planctomycetota bacterium]